VVLGVGVKGCYETPFAFLAGEKVSQNSSAGSTVQSNPARSRTGDPEPRRICAVWGGRAECWVQWEIDPSPGRDGSVS
jgi:hypothetical protein